jgi:hypothetical protein
MRRNPAAKPSAYIRPSSSIHDSKGQVASTSNSATATPRSHLRRRTRGHVSKAKATPQTAERASATVAPSGNGEKATARASTQTMPGGQRFSTHQESGGTRPCCARAIAAFR